MRENELLLWARFRVCVLLHEIARALKDEGRVMLAASKRLEPGR